MEFEECGLPREEANSCALSPDACPPHSTVTAALEMKEACGAGSQVQLNVGLGSPAVLGPPSLINSGPVGSPSVGLLCGLEVLDMAHHHLTPDFEWEEMQSALESSPPRSPVGGQLPGVSQLPPGMTLVSGPDESSLPPPQSPVTVGPVEAPPPPPLLLTAGASAGDSPSLRV